jgi:hypothetical protein
MQNLKQLSLVVSAAALLLAPAVGLAAPVQKTDGFVCPVISTEAVLHSPLAVTLGDTGDYSIIGPNVGVPVHATNADGAGVPGGAHASPGDTDYTAIWAL